jgi:pimeloyl-ACP methyl ester carboxylesterase
MFPTNGDRFAAGEVSKRMDTEHYTKKGFMLQAIAAGWHHKSSAQLKQIGDSVGRSRIQVIHGTYDHMITVPHGIVLLEELGGEESGVTGKIFQDCGHVIPLEKSEEFQKMIADLVDKCAAMKN